MEELRKALAAIGFHQEEYAGNSCHIGEVAAAAVVIAAVVF